MKKVMSKVLGSVKRAIGKVLGCGLLVFLMLVLTASQVFAWYPYSIPTGGRQVLNVSNLTEAEIYPIYPSYPNYPFSEADLNLTKEYFPNGTTGIINPAWYYARYLHRYGGYTMEKSLLWEDPRSFDEQKYEFKILAETQRNHGSDISALPIILYKLLTSVDDKVDSYIQNQSLVNATTEQKSGKINLTENLEIKGDIKLNDTLTLTSSVSDEFTTLSSMDRLYVGGSKWNRAWDFQYTPVYVNNIHANTDEGVKFSDRLHNPIMHLAEGGNVGIGKDNPQTKLDVAGDIKSSGTICDTNGCIGSTTNNNNNSNSEVPSGTWCGLCGDGEVNVNNCEGHDVCIECPSGYTKEGYSPFLYMDNANNASGLFETVESSNPHVDYVCIKA